MKALVLGIGNLILGDEGVGIHAVRRLLERGLPGGVQGLDGGTGGFHLLSLWTEYDDVVLIDATFDDRPAGTVAVLRPRFAAEFPRALGAHDIGLRDLIETGSLLGPLPSIHLVTVSIEDVQPMCLDLTPVVAGALDEVERVVLEIIAEIQAERAREALAC